MPDRRSELFREEDEAWAELCGLLEKVPPADMERPGLNGEWSAKDLLGHLASWWAEAASQLERMRFGTFRLERRDIDEVNRRFYEANHDLDLHTVRAELAASRNRAFDALSRLPELNPQAEEWFRESGALHYGEHMKDLRRFVELISSP
jgi:DinB superfamily